MSRLLVTWGKRMAQTGTVLAPTQRPSTRAAEQQRLHAAWGTAASEPSSAIALGSGRWGGPGEERRSLPPGT